tara:strand:+ start:1162 stop:2403 length:1242 start_codon:yes stop_codon:yes gene_type:complete
MELIIVLVAILFSALFSGVEIAFASSNKLQLELDKVSEKMSSKVIAFFSKNESIFITTILIGKNFSLVVYAIAMYKLLTPLISNYISSPFFLLPIQTIISTLTLLFAAEFLPKSIFKIYPNTILKLLSIPIYFFYLIFYPFALLFLNGSKLILKFFFAQSLSKNKDFFNKKDLDDYLSHLNNDKTSTNTEVEMLQNTLQLSSKKLRECMIPRTEIIALNINATIEEIKEKFIETKLSKILIYKNNIDNIVGYVHSSDLFRNPRNIRSLLLPIPFVPETMYAMQLLSDFIDEDKGVALVVDEFGGTSGMITIEDMTEEIVGEIEDEYDEDNHIFEKINENEYNILARAEVLFINKKLNLNIPESEEYETIAGYVLDYFENIPLIDSIIDEKHYKITIMEVDDRSVISVHLEIKR